MKGTGAETWWINTGSLCGCRPQVPHYLASVCSAFILNLAASQTLLDSPSATLEGEEVGGGLCLSRSQSLLCRRARRLYPKQEGMKEKEEEGEGGIDGLVGSKENKKNKNKRKSCSRYQRSGPDFSDLYKSHTRNSSERFCLCVSVWHLDVLHTNSRQQSKSPAWRPCWPPSRPCVSSPAWLNVSEVSCWRRAGITSALISIDVSAG